MNMDPIGLERNPEATGKEEKRLGLGGEEQDKSFWELLVLNI